ncbi:MAG: hypothetical protein PVG79_12300 [Gemmatimonadales bacterium]|jgi:hypothetical protein
MIRKLDRPAYLTRFLGVVFAVALGLGGVRDVAAQTVEYRRGTRGEPRADARLREVLARGSYRVLTRDTVLAADEVIGSDVIVIRATLRLEGLIEGDVVGVQSDIFARPGGRISGAVVVLGGGFYGSSLAELGSPPIDASRYLYGVEEIEGGRYVVTAPGGGASFRLPGLYGFLLPEYDRVNALTVRWGADLERGPEPWMPDARGRMRYRSVREQFDGDLELSWPFGRQAFVLRGGRTVRSNDEWINGRVENSLYAVIGGVDTRNYYDARFVEGDLRLIVGSRVVWTNDVVVGWERARSLENRDPFSIFEVRDGFGPNLPVRERDAALVKLVSVAQVMDGRISPLEVELRIEHADADVAGDLSFTVFGAAVLAELPTWRRGSLVLEGRGQLPTSSGAPEQRWRALGGWGTLPTLRTGERQGDRMWWTAATLRAPLGRRVGIRWELVPWLQYAVGNAWVEGAARPSTVHNLGVGLSVGPLCAALYTAPRDDFKTALAIGFDRLP